MTDSTARRRVVAVALARGATVLALDADLTPADEGELAGLLDHLTRQGVVACFSIAPAGGRLGRMGVLDALRPHVGRDALEATLAAGAPPSEPRPAFLCSVWPFEPGAHGLIAAGQFLGLDLELFASPSTDEEAGFRLPTFENAFALYTAPLARPL